MTPLRYPSRSFIPRFALRHGHGHGHGHYHRNRNKLGPSQADRDPITGSLILRAPASSSHPSSHPSSHAPSPVVSADKDTNCLPAAPDHHVRSADCDISCMYVSDSRQRKKERKSLLRASASTSTIQSNTWRSLGHFSVFYFRRLLHAQFITSCIIKDGQ